MSCQKPFSRSRTFLQFIRRQKRLEKIAMMVLQSNETAIGIFKFSKAAERAGMQLEELAAKFETSGGD